MMAITERFKVGEVTKFMGFTYEVLLSTNELVVLYDRKIEKVYPLRFN